MTEEMVTAPEPDPEFVTVPALFSDTVEIVKLPVLLALNVRFWLPVMPPDIVQSPVPVEVKVLRLASRVMLLLMVSGDVFV